MLLDPEPHNFTYEISNEAELADWTAAVTGCDRRLAESFVAEPSRDLVLKDRLRKVTAGHWLWTKPAPPFGKRLGWYAVARVLRPRLVIEIGAHDGLGALLLLRALERNADEGHAGRLVSFDINPNAGWLVGRHSLWDLRIQSSRDGLQEVLDTANDLDLFIYDGWHSYEDERSDLEVAAEHLADGGVLISDDAQMTHALRDLCDQRELAYFEFRELPTGHFYPGSVLAAGRSASGLRTSGT